MRKLSDSRKINIQKSENYSEIISWTSAYPSCSSAKTPELPGMFLQVAQEHND